MKSVRKALVIPYFGKWPEWFDLYLYSLERNPSLDVIFFTDIPIDGLQKSPPPNAKFVTISFTDYCRRVSDALGVVFCPSNYYKLCEIKPFYPFIHWEELKDYDYVGWGDIDLIYGNLEVFFPDSKIGKYDIVSAHSFLFSGHFLLMKNDASIYRNFLNIPYWKELLADPNNRSIDEIQLSSFLTPKLKYARYIYDKSGGYRGVHRRWAVMIMQLCARVLYPQYHLREMYTSPKPFNNIYTYENGRVFENGCRELPYIHFWFFKKPNYETNREQWGDDFYHLDNRTISSDIRVMFDRRGIWPIG